jgi:hypothetical protein
VTSAETLNWHARWEIAKYDEDVTAWLTEKLGRAPQGADFEAARVKAFEVGEVDRNLLTTAGVTRMASLLVAGGGQALTATSGRIGVGNGAGSAAVGDTDLSAAAGSTNRWFNIFDATYPTVAAGVITAWATFGSADGNFSWTEFGMDIGTPTVASSAVVSAVLLNHKPGIAQGTKTAGQSWTAKSTLTLS